MNPAQGHADDKRNHQQTDRVVKVIELERLVTGDFLGVSPGPPAEHAEGHQEERDEISVRGEHIDPTKR